MNSNAENINNILSKSKNLRMDILRYPKTVYTTGVGGRARQGPYRRHDVGNRQEIFFYRCSSLANNLFGR